jgi:sentrin-specific protease 7
VLYSDDDEGEEGGNGGDAPGSGTAAAAKTQPLPLRGGQRLPGFRYAGMRCVFPVGGGRSSVEVVADDLNRLEAQEFLNDTIIDFYVRCVFGRAVALVILPC